MGLFAFVVAIACISPFPDGATGVRWAVISIVAPVLFWRHPPFMPTVGHAFLVLLMWWCTASLLWTQVLVEGLYTYWHLLLFVAITLLPADMRKVYIGAGVALAINGLVVGAQLLGFDPVSQAVPPAGLFFNKNFGAEMTALVLIGLVLSSGINRIALAALVAPMLITMLAWQGNTFSRAPVLALLAAGVGWVWSKDRFWGIQLGVVGLGLLVYLIAMPGRITHAAQRLQIWADGASQLSVFGHGVGSFNIFFPEAEFAHNDFLQIAFELGAPGLALWIAFLVYCLRGGALTERLVLIAFVVEGCFGFPLYLPGTTLVAALAAGALLRGRPLVRDLLPER